MIRNAVIVESFGDAARWLESATQQAFQGSSTTIANSLSEGKTLVHRLRPDLIMIDLDLPDGRAVDLIAEVKLAQPSIVAIATTLFDDDERIVPALRAGASGYLLKQDSAENLACELGALLHGESGASPFVARSTMNYFSSGRRAHNCIEELTPGELEVLTAIAGGDSLPQVSHRLNMSSDAIATHIAHVFEKLNLATRVEATIIAVRLGMVAF
jgi:DNA-binding NarL/FixJ family response regulator